MGARYLIQTPVKGATTDIGSVHFHQGQVELDEVPYWLERYCVENGYSITDQQPPAEQDQADDGVGDDDNNPVTAPPANAKTEVWREHVLAIGGDRVTAEQVATLTRDQLRELAAQLAGSGQEGQQQS